MKYRIYEGKTGTYIESDTIRALYYHIRHNVRYNLRYDEEYHYIVAMASYSNAELIIDAIEKNGLPTWVFFEDEEKQL